MRQIAEAAGVSPGLVVHHFCATRSTSTSWPCSRRCWAS
ncbi:TetR family transcriptional regulator [Streptomyces canus]|nr:TetR family transcriptional regulator [Streptomyces canus]MCX4854966.1 TetR/AcrR family transcriptional regulator [Streptomyces canus]